MCLVPPIIYFPSPYNRFTPTLPYYSITLSLTLTLSHTHIPLFQQKNMMSELNDFDHFDVVPDDSDHYFRIRTQHTNTTKKQKNNHQSTTNNNNIESTDIAVRECFTNANDWVYKKIMVEWKILSRNLPDSIYVRVYENRIDLMRAVIVGAAATPYHDGLYFFDIAFPPDFPNHPPKVHYRSFGLKLNPNLYHNGKVCLSLINTWNGKKNERWVPSVSTVLQLLVSLQGLVLNDTPFFNEAGSEILGRGIFEKRARSYNETVFTLNIRTMMCLIHRPPMHFEEFIYAHFRSRSDEILRACNHYVNGRVRVGWYGVSGECSSGLSKRVKVSQEFKESMVVFYPRLVEAFNLIRPLFDIDLELLEMENNDENKELLKNGHGGAKKYRVRKIVRKVIGKIRKFYASSELKIRHRSENSWSRW